MLSHPNQYSPDNTHSRIKQVCTVPLSHRLMFAPPPTRVVCNAREPKIDGSPIPGTITAVDQT